jgi:NAD+ synthase (glutamine-hydrolysing)
VGDIDGNAERLVEAIDKAQAAGAQLLVTPELSITGYPPDDLLLKPTFLQANEEAARAVAERARDVLAVIGFVEVMGEVLHNSAAICHGGRIIATYRKHLLPNYGVFDERRHFTPGRGHTLLETTDAVLGVTVCEDVWDPGGPVVKQGQAGAQIVLNINASPYHKGKLSERAEMLGERARAAGASIVYCNTVGGQDELLFDGGSLVAAPDGALVSRFPQFEEHFGVVDVPAGAGDARPHPAIRRMPVTLADAGEPPPEPVIARQAGDQEEIYEGLVLAIADYVRKNGFPGVVLGLSGGIDSSLVATIAADALGPGRVLGLLMPSEYTSEASIEDASELAANLGIDTRTISIGDVYKSYIEVLDQAFGPGEPGVAEENIQARIRGNLVMAVSNRYGQLAVATGNKSEMAVGYATLYGDMAGGFALLKDVLKTEVYALAEYRNSIDPVIPKRVLEKPPSAELKPGQTDQDSLPPYSLLDSILEAYIERDEGVDAIARRGLDRDTVEEVVALVDRAEYKRRQAPPGPKVTARAFGRDRRLPITNLWREGGKQKFPGRLVGEAGPK